MQESITIAEAKEKLRKLILNKGLKWNEGLLNDGQVPKWIFDLREIILNHEGLRLATELIYEKIKNLDFDMIGGPSIAAEPLVASLILRFYNEGKSISGFIVRKQPNNFGLRKKIEGPIEISKKVVLIDDALNFGISMSDALKSLRQEGCSIVKIITLVDFKKSGHSKLVEQGYDVDFIFNLKDFELESNRLYKYKDIGIAKIKIFEDKTDLFNKVSRIVHKEIIDLKVHDGLILAAFKDGLLYCFDENYSVKWKFELGDSISASIFVDGSTAVISAYSGLNSSLLFFIYIHSGTILKYFRMKGNITFEPLLYKDSYLLCSGNSLYLINKGNYTTSLIFEARGDITTMPLIDDRAEAIYINSLDNTCALTFNGSEIWKRHFGKIRLSPLLRNEKLIFVSDTNVVFCINKRDGNLIWFFELKNKATDIKIVLNEVVVGCFGGYLLLLDIQNGKILESFKLSNSNIKKIIENNDKLLFELDDGNHYIGEIR